MAIHKITYSKRFKRANLHNYGCNFDCAWCSYKLKDNGKPETFLSLSEIKRVLDKLDVDKVHIIGGEPTICSGLAEIVDYVKKEMGLYFKIGHSTCFKMPPDNIDAISISIKSHSEQIHINYTGVSNATVLRNFLRTYEKGITVDASSVYIPGLIECYEIEKIAQFIAGIDPNIPYHIIGYVPVPDSPWQEPSRREMENAKEIAKDHLNNVTTSCLSVEGFLELHNTDVRYDSIQVA